MHRLNGVPATPDFSSIILLPIASRDHLGSDALRERRRWIGFLNDLFYGRSYIVAPAELSISFLLDDKIRHRHTGKTSTTNTIPRLCHATPSLPIGNVN